MAQSRLLSIIAKQDKLETDLFEMDKVMSKLLKEVREMRKKHFGNKAKSDATKNKVQSEDILSILQESQNLDQLMLKIQNLLNRCSAHSFYIQRQLELRSYQNQPPNLL